MAAAMTTHDDVETQANKLEEAFKTLARDWRTLEEQFGGHTYYISPNDTRVAPWMAQFTQTLNESEQWIKNLKRQTKHHNFWRQELYSNSIQRTVQEANDIINKSRTAADTCGLLDKMYDQVDDHGSWVLREREKKLVMDMNATKSLNPFMIWA
jgi:hypothetical protein